MKRYTPFVMNNEHGRPTVYYDEEECGSVVMAEDAQAEIDRLRASLAIRDAEIEAWREYGVAALGEKLVANASAATDADRKAVQG